MDVAKPSQSANLIRFPPPSLHWPDYYGGCNMELSSLSATLPIRVLVLAVLLSTSLGSATVSADDSIELLSAEQQAYVKSTQAALDDAFSAVDSLEPVITNATVELAFSGDEAAISMFLQELASARTQLLVAAETLRSTPPTSMSGLREVNLEAANAFENAYLTCSEMLTAHRVNSALEQGRDALGELFGVSLEEGKTDSTAGARFLACVMSESARVKHHLLIAQDALSTRVAELNEEEQLERDLLGDQGGALCFLAARPPGRRLKPS